VKLRIVSLGHKLPEWARIACAGYYGRLPRGYAIEGVELKAQARTGRPASHVLELEAQAITAAVRGCHVVALDEKGSAWTTSNFVHQLTAWRDRSLDVAFVIGSADGLAPQIKQNAHVTLALSALTLPHALARVVLAEQIYRVVTVIEGHPYHRD